MKKPDAKLYDLIQSLSTEEKPKVRRQIALYEKEGSTIYQRVFDAFAEMETHDETALRKVFPDLSHIKETLYPRVLESLRNLFQADDAELNISRQIEYAYILEKKNLYRQAMDAIEEAKDYCDKNLLLFHKALLHQRESSVGNYLPGNNFKEFLTKTIDENKSHLQQLTEVYRARDFYLNVMQAEAFRSMQTNHSEMMPVETFLSHPLYTADTDKLHLNAAIYIAKAKRTLHYYRKEFDKCYQAEAPIEKRIRNPKRTEPVPPASHWNWLVDRCNLHEAAMKLDVWEQDVLELKTLHKKFFPRDAMRETFIHRNMVELRYYQYSAPLPNKEHNQLVTANLNQALEDAKTFITKTNRDIKDEPTAFLLSAVLLINIYNKNWKAAEELCEDFSARVSTKIVDDIHRFARLIKPVIYDELNNPIAINNWVTTMRHYMKNNPDKDFSFDRVVTNFFAKYYKADKESRNTLLPEFAEEMKTLVDEANIFAQSFCLHFDLKEWAEDKSKKTN